MKKEVELPKNLCHSTMLFRENNLGAIEVDTMHYDHTSILEHTIRIFDNRKEKSAYGKEVFSGTIEDMLKRLIGQ